MDNVQRFTHAYSQAPWRKQLQLIGLFMLGVIVVALIAGIYLNVTARTATIGRNIQSLRFDIKEQELNIADLESQLALITSNREMQARAEELGFTQVDSDEIFFIVVPGYSGRQADRIASQEVRPLPQSRSLSLNYTQSLFDWVRERVFEPAAPLSEVRP
jgi:cell division protein FtsL